MSVTSNFPNLAEVFRKGKEGHVEALKLLKLESGKHSPLLTGLPKIKKDTLRKDTLKQEIANTYVGIEAAEWLGMSNLKLLYRDRQAYLMEMYELLYKERPKIGLRIKNSRLIEFMKTLVQENVEDIIDLTNLEVDAADIVELEEDEGRDIPSDEKEEKEGAEEGEEKESKKEEEEKAEREEEKWESNSSDDSYDPVKDPASGDSSSDEEEEQRKSAKRPFPLTSVPTKKKRPSSSSLPETKKKKTSASLPKSASPLPSKSASPATAESDNGDSKRSHHSKKRCPVPKCNFNGSDLRRHLGVHVKKGHIAEEAIESLLAIVRAGPREIREARTLKCSLEMKDTPCGQTGWIQRWKCYALAPFDRIWALTKPSSSL